MGSSSCSQCGHEVSERARFCEQCGAPLKTDAEPLRAPEPLAEKIISQRSAIEGERKQVTVMFTDIVRSMELTRELDTERWGLLLDRFLAIACRSIHELEGTVNQFTGDGLMAVFGAPLAHEDHARRACLAALRLQRELEPFAEDVAREDGVSFRVRCGLNSGEVIIGSIGDDLHMAFAPIGNTSGMGKRMESLAPEESTAISASTAALVEGEFELRELGEFEVKGVSEPQRVFELRGPGAAHSRLEAAAVRGLSRFVGRGAEQAALEAALGRALAGDGRIVGIIGEPGVGKSRLCREFVRECHERGVRVNSGSAVAHGRAVPLLSVLAMFRDLFGIDERDTPEAARERIERVLRGLDPGFEPDLALIFDFLGVPDPQRPAERIDPEARQRRLLTFLRRLVHARSRQETAVIVIEDLHWIDPASAAFLDELVSAVEGTRTLLIVTFRPEYDAEWTSSPAFERHELEPLDDDATGELLGDLLGGDPSLDGLAELVGERTAGNPFFIEEVVRALTETGHLAGDRGAFRLAGALDQLVLPPTVQAVLAARIDRLAGREKALVQTMAVIGKEVPEPILVEVTDLDESALGDSVRTLEAAEFLTEARSNGQREFTFKHPLTQEVAYTSQLSGSRARAHAAVAEAIERVYPDGLDERAALLAHHVEAAGKMLSAAGWHARAAARISVSSPADGMRHWRRVRELTDELESSPEAVQLAVLARISILALAWRVGMSHEETAAIHAEGQERLGTEVPDDTETQVVRPASGTHEAAEASILLDIAYGTTLFLGGREREGHERARAVWDSSAELGDPGLMLTAAALASLAGWEMGFPLDVIQLTDQAIAKAGEDVNAGGGLMLACPYASCFWMRGCSFGYMGRLEEAWQAFDHSLEFARNVGDLECESYALVTRSVLRSEVGELDLGLLDAERGLGIAERAGNKAGLVAGYGALAVARVRRGELDTALEAAERTLEMARKNRVNVEWEPILLAILAEAKLGLGRTEEARRSAEEALAIADRRALPRGGLAARLVLVRVRAQMSGAEAASEIERILAEASDLAAKASFHLYEPQIHRLGAVLARLRADEETARRDEAAAERVLEAMARGSAERRVSTRG